MGFPLEKSTREQEAKNQKQWSVKFISSTYRLDLIQEDYVDTVDEQLLLHIPCQCVINRNEESWDKAVAFNKQQQLWGNKRTFYLKLKEENNFGTK